MSVRFLVDENCAQLTKWLRFFGMDAKDVLGLHDSDVSRLALNENRLLISRDRALCRYHPGPLICLYSDDLREQLLAIFREIGLPDESDWFSLCVLCNVKIEALTEDEIEKESKIPPSVRTHKKYFWRCPHCLRIYWEGSHFDRTEIFLKEISHELSPG